MVKNDWGCRDHRTLKSSVPHKWFDKLSRLIAQFLCTDSDGTVFGLTSSLLCIFDIYFVLFPYASQSSQIIWENFFLKFLKSMIKHRSLQKGSYKISSVHLSICLSVCLSVTHFFQNQLSGWWMFLIFCTRIFCHIH